MGGGKHLQGEQLWHSKDGKQNGGEGLDKKY